MIKLIFTCFILLSTTNLFAHYPKNKYWIPTSYKSSNITEKQFHGILDRIEKIYAPIIKEHGGDFIVSRRWTNGTVNASAQRIGNKYIINMFGGLARHPKMTPDAFAMVACHEIGHHIGGIPKYVGIWASNEGQADYFATLKCFRRYAEMDNNLPFMKRFRVPQTVSLLCNKSFSNQEDLAICQRNSIAGKNLADLLGALGRTGDTDFDTPDPREVSRTQHTHPVAQCRLDTYFQGAICPVEVEDEVDYKDPNKGTCHRFANFELGFRPLCWFKPKRS